ncbi:FAD-dependent monooxygenase [Nocardia sp. R6R-6]|uniref:FAD-dependent monooxygenase n=1 Tax=Nocardia sp. R6R-6 TaxID=3459303 RepID=UPI00403DDDEB
MSTKSVTSQLRVLVAGGGISGNAVAPQLLRSGIRVTVVERAAAPRPGGQAVDLRGPSREVAERMGMMPGIRDFQLDERGMKYVDDAGREILRMPSEYFDGRGAVAEIEITRGDLNRILLDLLAAEGCGDYRYGEWITAIEQDHAGVDMTFRRLDRRQSDLAVAQVGFGAAHPWLPSAATTTISLQSAPGRAGANDHSAPMSTEPATPRRPARRTPPPKSDLSPLETGRSPVPGGGLHPHENNNAGAGLAHP